ncbi:MAG: 23S rRNA (pseudouridine(1915)-N(3))-methyltransferase RlmH [Saccharofermentanales bacterium]|jgi:23S rRNA (pseudouridine1915-N3)-methyltransferase
MRLIILSPGKIREKWLQAGIDEYVKRLRRFAQVEFQIVEDVPDSWPATKAIDEEGRRLLARLRPQSFVVALDHSGVEPDSIDLADLLPDWLNRGKSQVVFVIGGSNGLAPSVLERAQERLCLSRLTFTHQMARLILLEQCYRAFKIAAGEAYHK